ncbi:hypothetical protein BRADI_3g27720v3 [Brachypodium distachyon]|uniref:Uncharacterized protein n=1 Tax=Brachypodium distachyon TaxID=15368 RepID=A0A2K2CZL1_BRADI|nr:hypothetical protein BRADI_3g27720v3 [Brachypodium distachyon]PNT67464.1 hypothetical protein BRADI_3g27720v3 [Brachypodium distachyon]
MVMRAIRRGKLIPSRELLNYGRRFSEFGSDGGTAAKALSPKINIFVENVSSRTGIVVPHIELKHVIAVAIALKGIGGLLFILSSSFGASLLGALCADAGWRGAACWLFITDHMNERKG